MPLCFALYASHASSLMRDGTAGAALCFFFCFTMGSSSFSTAVSVTAAFEALAWVTLGNIIGGAGGVALAYRYAYGALRD